MVKVASIPAESNIVPGLASRSSCTVRALSSQSSDGPKSLLQYKRQVSAARVAFSQERQQQACEIDQVSTERMIVGQRSEERRAARLARATEGMARHEEYMRGMAEERERVRVEVSLIELCLTRTF